MDEPGIEAAPNLLNDFDKEHVADAITVRLQTRRLTLS